MNFEEGRALRYRLSEARHRANSLTEHAVAMLAAELDKNHGAPGATPVPKSQQLDITDAAIDEAIKAQRAALRAAEVLRTEVRRHMKAGS